MTRITYLNIAGFNFCLKFYQEELLYFTNSFLDHFYKKYKEFISNQIDKVDYTIIFRETNKLNMLVKEDSPGIEKFYFLHSVFYEKERKVYTTYFISEMHFEMLLKKLIGRLLAENSGFFLHGSACNYDNKVLIFLGRSGIGKSTIVQLLNNFTQIYADDIFIVRLIKDKFYFYQVPFYEKNWRFPRSNKPYSLSKLFFLKQAQKIKAHKIHDINQILKILLNQFIATQEDEATKSEFESVIDLLVKFSSAHEFYKLEFNQDKVAVGKYIKALLNI